MTIIKSYKTLNLNGQILVPGDKSISHRALILASCAIGESTISNLLESEDVFSTLKALKKLGIKIKKIKHNWHVYGNGLGSISGFKGLLNLGNSGTGVRLIMGLISGSNSEVTFTGDNSLIKRPMKRVIDPLTQSGAHINSSDSRLPLTIKGTEIPLPVNYTSDLSSAQVKSAVLICGLTSSGLTNYYEPMLSRDHTERMLKFMGAEIQTTKFQSNWKISLVGLPNLKNVHFDVPNDPSSASFPIVSALITPNSKIEIRKILMNKLRIGFLKTLIEMGGKIEVINERKSNGERIADLIVQTSNLKGINVPAERAPSMIDEYPVLSVAASFAKGITTFNGVEELKYKETDRIVEVVKNLNRLNIKSSSTKNKIIITGNNNQLIKGGIEIDSKLDHRIAMSFLCMGFMAEQPIVVKKAETIQTSFPNFYKSMKQIGANLY